MVCFVQKEEIHKGWSGDKKYCVTDAQGNKFLLRVSPKDQRERKRQEFERMQVVAKLGIPMCLPLEFGETAEEVYSVQTWIDGVDVEEVIASYSETEQYAYGWEAGEILRKIHAIPAPEGQEDWESWFNRKMDYKVKSYRECPLSYENGDAFLQYIENNRHLLKNRPQSYQHGDYHVGNMMLDRTGKLHIVDFNRDSYGDPWEEFNRIVWCAQASPLFATGMVDGYFLGEVPEIFWRLMTLYISSNTLGSLTWCLSYGEEEIAKMKNQAAQVLDWYDGMTRIVPKWYQKNFTVQCLDGVPVKLRSAFDVCFVQKYGTVFQVYDDQDSGNLCFGVEKNGERFFVKFAGAPTVRYSGEPTEAIERLKASEPIYRELAHPNLIEWVDSEEIGGGFAMVFRWSEGECFGRMYPASRAKFLATDLETRKKIFFEILDFLEHVAKRGYVAIDFYDGSILYDFQAGKTVICDIDFFRKMPCVNDMGRMWGSATFMSPEEMTLGAVLDEVTNVYTAGAMAFALFADRSRERTDWPLSDASFSVVSQAVTADRGHRPQSIRQLRELWEVAVGSEDRNRK